MSTFLSTLFEIFFKAKAPTGADAFIYAGKRDNLPYLKTTPPGTSLLSVWIPDPGGERYFKKRADPTLLHHRSVQTLRGHALM